MQNVIRLRVRLQLSVPASRGWPSSSVCSTRPAGRGPGAAPVPPTITVTTAKAQQVTGKLAYRDEFTITLIDSDGWNRSWPISMVKIEGEDPLRAHAEVLGKYSDQNIHDVFAYLQSLK